MWTEKGSYCENPPKKLWGGLVRGGEGGSGWRVEGGSGWGGVRVDENEELKFL